MDVSKHTEKSRPAQVKLATRMQLSLLVSKFNLTLSYLPILPPSTYQAAMAWIIC